MRRDLVEDEGVYVRGAIPESGPARDDFFIELAARFIEGHDHLPAWAIAERLRLVKRDPRSSS